MANTQIENEILDSSDPATMPLLVSVHAIENREVVAMNMDSDNLFDFSSSLYQQAEEAKNTKAFKFNSSTTEVVSELLTLCRQYLSDIEIFEQNFHQSANIISLRLNRAQIDSEERNKGMKTPSDGALTIIFSPEITNEEKKFKILISKIDIKEYLERQHAVYEKGFPIENKTQKSCLIDLTIINDDEQTLNSVLISDSTTTIAKFWTQYFLEIDEIRSDLKNTKDAFDSIKVVLNRRVKNQSPKDYTVLNNNLIGYFQRVNDYKHEDMLAEVIGDYKPEKEDFDIEGLKNSLLKLPEDKNFDTHFSIDNSEIKSKFTRDINVSDNVILKTKDHIDDIKRNIFATKDDTEEKILVIRNISDEAYNAFKQNESSDE